MAEESAAARALAKLERRLFLASKAFGPRREGPARVLFVAGVQRSGTNMVMDVLEASRATDVIHERDPRAYHDYMMRAEGTIDALIARGSRPVFAIKALHESERVAGLLERFAPAKLIWVFRRPDAVIASNRKSWPEGRNRIEDLVADPAKAGWRGFGITPETLARVRAAYTPDIPAEAAQALFYFYRNQLFFDQKFAHDERALLVDYDALVADPSGQIARIAAFAGIAATPRMIALPKAPGGKERPPIALPPAIRVLADEMHARLLAAVRG